MTPSDYTSFRDALGQSSEFQSFQYRQIEFLLGNRNPAMLLPHAHRSADHAALSLELTLPSLYDVALQQLAQTLPVPDHVLARDLSGPYTADDAVTAAWTKVYKTPDQYWELYELAEKLVDCEDYFRRWRFNHFTTVERVIGFKRGTSGVSYLRRMPRGGTVSRTLGAAHRALARDAVPIIEITQISAPVFLGQLTSRARHRQTTQTAPATLDLARLSIRGATGPTA